MKKNIKVKGISKEAKIEAPIAPAKVEAPVKTPEIIETMEELFNYALEVGEKSFGIMYGQEGEQKKIIGNRYVDMDMGLWVEAEIKARVARIEADKLKLKVINK